MVVRMAIKDMVFLVCTKHEKKTTLAPFITKRFVRVPNDVPMLHLPSCVAVSLDRKYGRARTPTRISRQRLFEADGDTSRPARDEETNDDECVVGARVCATDRMPPMPLLESGARERPCTRYDSEPNDTSCITYDALPKCLHRLTRHAPAECITFDGDTFWAHSHDGHPLGASADRRIATLLVRIGELDASLRPDAVSRCLRSILTSGHKRNAWWKRVDAESIA